uniref:Uncharacterized protein n=1 Tax=Solanum lycopersicum TaxID=4081 RepID=A0A3Q7EB00_SOLLC
MEKIRFLAINDNSEVFMHIAKWLSIFYRSCNVLSSYHLPFNLITYKFIAFTLEIFHWGTSRVVVDWKFTKDKLKALKGCSPNLCSSSFFTCSPNSTLPWTLHAASNARHAVASPSMGKSFISSRAVSSNPARPKISIKHP